MSGASRVWLMRASLVFGGIPTGRYAIGSSQGGGPWGAATRSGSSEQPADEFGHAGGFRFPVDLDRPAHHGLFAARHVGDLDQFRAAADLGADLHRLREPHLVE